MGQNQVASLEGTVVLCVWREKHLRTGLQQGN